MSALGDSALELAGRGWPVFRLARRRKTPMIAKRLGGTGFKEATTDPETVARWWSESPAANVGVATVGDLFVLDVDPRNGGDQSLATLLDGRTLPPTPEVHTGGGGRHFYFAAAEGLTGDLGPGLDLKAGGGYVVAPPSIHPSGRVYTWHPERGPDTARSPLPRWLADRLAPESPPRSTRLPTPSGDDDFLGALTPPAYFRDLAGLVVGAEGGKVCCPFHSDRSPSLHVYPNASGPESGWYCFGCQRGGDLYTFAALLGGFALPLRGADFLNVEAVLLDLYEKRLGVEAA